MNNFDINLISFIAVRLWVIFGLAFLALSILKKHLPKSVDNDCFVCQWMIHILVIVGIGALIPPIFEAPESLQPLKTMVVSRFIIILEITIYLIVLRMLDQQRKAFSTLLILKESELQALRSQSNPHFLFNTLNLVISEISNDPDNAKDIVFDLADLLRKYLKMAKQNFTTVTEELKLVGLYLNLQQKRFKNRLTFDIEVEPAAKALNIPSLLLQPVVENTIKHAVAPYARQAHIQVRISISNQNLLILFKDSGPKFDEKSIVEGDGYRILRKTLNLHYPNNYTMSLTSTESGGEFHVKLPMSQTEHNYD